MENKTTTDTGEALTKDLDTLKQDLSQIATDIKGHAKAHAEATHSLIQDKIQKARDAAAARPFAILGVGFLLGFLFAVRFRR
jgi:hypothetical protein